MKIDLRASPIVLATLLLAAAGAAQDQPVIAAAQSPAVPAPGVPTEGLAPIPGHPPITMSGRLKSVDTRIGAITFEDGRTAVLSRDSEVLVPSSVERVQPGIPIVIRNALPVGVPSRSGAAGADAAGAASAGKGQRMGTVESVDESDQVVQLTDGTAVRVPPSTQVRRGIAGPAIVLADLQPGDELVIVTADDASTAGRTESAPSASPGASTSPSPRVPSEVMVFTPALIP
jgi:hypothetical protein